MEDMDLVIDPRRQIVDVNPLSPNIASGIVKRAVSVAPLPANAH
jgi:hypothetical protein